MHHLLAMKMTFLKLFLIGTFKDPKIGGKINQVGGKKKEKKVELRGVHGVFFPSCWAEAGVGK